MKGKNIIKTVVVCVDAAEGRTIASCLGSDGEVVRGKARCMEGDEFKPEIGAIIALCKALGVAPVKACYDVMDVYAKDSADKVEKAKVKEAQARAKVTARVSKPVKAKAKHKYEMIDAGDLKGIVCGKVKRGHCVLKAAGLLAPTDKSTKDYGVMGTYTRFYDTNGKPLFVGDLVTVDVLQGDVRTGRHWVSTPGLTFVVDERSDNPVSKGKYIMGLMSGCNDRTGKIDRKFRIRKVKDWKEVEIGEVNSNGQIQVVWEDEV